MLAPEPIELGTSNEGIDEWISYRGIDCCDFIVILEDKHDGYRDFISITEHWAGPKAQEWTLWTYVNGQYESKTVSNESTFSGFYASYASRGVELGVWTEPRPLRIHAFIWVDSPPPWMEISGSLPNR